MKIYFSQLKGYRSLSWVYKWQKWGRRSGHKECVWEYDLQRLLGESFEKGLKVCGGQWIQEMKIDDPSGVGYDLSKNAWLARDDTASRLGKLELKLEAGWFNSCSGMSPSLPLNDHALSDRSVWNWGKYKKSVKWGWGLVEKSRYARHTAM